MIITFEWKIWKITFKWKIQQIWFRYLSILRPLRPRLQNWPVRLSFEFDSYLKAIVTLVWVSSMVVVIPDVLFTKYKVLENFIVPCSSQSREGPRKLYVALLFCSPSSPQGARWWSWRKATVLQGTEWGRYDRDSLWCLHAPCTGAQNNLYSIFMNRKSELKWKGWLIYVFGPSVLGPSACDGLHQWDDSIHPLEEEGNRRGTCKSGIFVKLMWKFEISTKTSF